MTYTIQAAQWGNRERTSAVIRSAEVGHVAISAADTPAEWAAFQTWAQTNPVTEPNWQAQDNEVARQGTFASDADRIDMLNRLKTATAAQIRTYVDNNVTNVAGAREMLKRILILIALDARS
jgi:hypothetical protein